MNKRKGILEELIKNYPNKILVKELLQELLGYFENYDLDCGTNHQKIFKILYFDRKGYERIIFETYISRSTLPRYIIRYNNLAMKFIFNKIDYIDLTKLLKT